MVNRNPLPMIYVFTLQRIGLDAAKFATSADIVRGSPETWLNHPAEIASGSCKQTRGDKT